MKKLDPVAQEKKDVKQFGYVGFVFFGALAALLFWKHRQTAAEIFAALSAFFIVFTLVAPSAMKHFYRVWMKVVGVIGWVNKQVLLSLVYFAVFAPFGFIMRLFHDPMRRRFDPKATSYWDIHPEKVFNPADYENRF